MNMVKQYTRAQSKGRGYSLDDSLLGWLLFNLKDLHQTLAYWVLKYDGDIWGGGCREYDGDIWGENIAAWCTVINGIL